MAYIKKEINKIVKDSGGKKKARMLSEQWFNDSLKSKKIKDVELTPKPFKPGMIYVFNYVHPLGQDYLDWWDKHPVVLALMPIDRNTDCGINLNLLPSKFREELLDKFYEAFHAPIISNTKGIKENNAILQKALIIRYDQIKKYLDKFGFGFAIRRYKTNLKRGQAVVSYESWARMALCDFIKLSGSTVSAVRRMFVEYNINRKF